MEVDYLINFFFFLSKKFVKKENIGNIHTKKEKQTNSNKQEGGGEGKKPTVFFINTTLTAGSPCLSKNRSRKSRKTFIPN